MGWGREEGTKVTVCFLYFAPTRTPPLVLFLSARLSSLFLCFCFVCFVVALE